MKNHVSPGSSIALPAPYDVLSGGGMLIGSLFAVACNPAANGQSVTAYLDGIFDLKKIAAQGWSVGALIYWDNTNKECTTVSSGNKLIGVAVAVAANPSPVGRVRLNGSFIS